MSKRRGSRRGATHSFALTPGASAKIDEIPHGQKSKQVSAMIIDWGSLKNPNYHPPPPTWRVRIWSLVARMLRRR